MLRMREIGGLRVQSSGLLDCHELPQLAAWLATELRGRDPRLEGWLAVCHEDIRDWELWRLPSLVRASWPAGAPVLAELRQRGGEAPIALTAEVDSLPSPTLALPLHGADGGLLGGLFCGPAGDAELGAWLGEAGALLGLIIERIARGRQLQTLEREVAELESLKNDFRDTVSHELRTPLTTILGFTEMAMMQPGVDGQPPLCDFLDSIRIAAGKLDRLIAEVLTVNSLADAEGLLDVVDCSLPALLAEFKADWLAPLPGAERVCWRDEAGDRTVRVDPRQFERILEHLVKNALAFSPPDADVQVALSSLVGRRRRDDSDFLRVDVVDGGPGIAPEEQERIFRRFYQVDGSSTRSKGGVGLGLALAKQFTEAMGGRLWVDSRPGEGATFSFTVPMLRQSSC